MKTLIPAAIRCSLMFTGVAALSLAYPASVQAVPTTYQYTGNPFTVATGPYSTSDFVTAMVTLAGPLGANMPLTQVIPTAFTLSDGVQTLRSTTPALAFQDFRFATNARGEINFWIVDVNAGRPDIFTFNLFGHGSEDSGSTREGVGFNLDTPGAWSLASVADTGSTLSLMTLTLMALGLVARRFQRADRARAGRSSLLAFHHQARYIG